MNLKEYMHDNPTTERFWCARMHSGQRAFGGQFSVCLFIVVLAVCGWVMHRRLSQYDTPQQEIHQSTAIKVCVTKRNPLSVPSMRGSDAFAVFLLLAFSLAAILNSPGNDEAAVAYRVRRDQSDQHVVADICSCLHHFFVLPPPSRLSVL
jgi:hypothetical protein